MIFGFFVMSCTPASLQHNFDEIFFYKLLKNVAWDFPDLANINNFLSELHSFTALEN